VAAPRLLIIDATTNKRIATELKARGRDAVSTPAMGLRGALDAELLERLAGLDLAWVLVGADDHMPEEHADEVACYDATLAIIDPLTPDGYERDQFERDVVHKWAHRMQEQEQGTVYRYTVRGRTVWKAPRRPRRPRREQRSDA